MAVADTQVLSAPKVQVDGMTIKILPNSFHQTVPGETKVHPVSAGGDAVSAVVGENVEGDMSVVKFDLAATAANIALITQWKANARNGIGSTLTASQGVWNDSWADMYVTNKVDIHHSSDGKFTVEWHGVRVLA